LKELVRKLQQDMIAVEQLHEVEGRAGSPRMEVPVATLRKIIDQLADAPKHGWIRVRVNGHDMLDPEHRGSMLLGTEGNEVELIVRMPDIAKATHIIINQNGSVHMHAADASALPMAPEVPTPFRKVG
jgi:hypothetical protein